MKGLKVQAWHPQLEHWTCARIVQVHKDRYAGITYDLAWSSLGSLISMLLDKNAGSSEIARAFSVFTGMYLGPGTDTYGEEDGNFNRDKAEASGKFDGTLPAEGPTEPTGRLLPGSSSYVL